MITVTIIEDNQTFAKALQKLIENDSLLTCINIINNLKSSLSAIAQNHSDVVLLDIQLPDGLGSEYVSILKQISPTTHFIMCTSFEDDEYIFNSIKNGASGYILKSDSPEKIIASIKDVLNGGAPMSNAIAKKILNYFKEEQQVLEELTSKENELLQLLSSGLLYKEIAAKQDIKIDTVKKHCGNIYKKLNVNNKTEAINKFLKR
jgi:two-component system, NarL family, response regulator LiaR